MVTPGRFNSRANCAQSGSARRLWPGAAPDRPKQQTLQSVIGDVVLQWPFRARPPSPVYDCPGIQTVRDPQKSPDLTRAHPIVVMPQ